MAPPVLTPEPLGAGTASRHRWTLALVLSSNCCFAMWKIILKVFGTVKSSGRRREGGAKDPAERISNPLLWAFRLLWHFNPDCISSCRDKGAENVGRDGGAPRAQVWLGLVSVRQLWAGVDIEMQQRLPSITHWVLVPTLCHVGAVALGNVMAKPSCSGTWP